MDLVTYKWTDADNADLRLFYKITEEYYNDIAGGLRNRNGFVLYNLSESIHDVLVAYVSCVAIACAGLKRYPDGDAEVKLVWVEPGYRGKHIASKIMDLIEEKAVQSGFKRTILQTREKMYAAVSLYKNRGYYPIDNYPPYDKLEGAVCFAKDLA